MKKTTVLVSFILLASLHTRGAYGCSAAGAQRALDLVARAWHAAPQAAQPQQPQWKSREEYDAFTAMANEKDPKKRISLAEAFLQKFANSDFRVGAYEAIMQAYQQLGDPIKAIEAARKALELNPDDLQALGYLSFVFPFVFKADDPEAASALARAEADARRGLEALGKLQKPANVAEEQFNQFVRAQRALFNNAIGFVALQRKDYPVATTAFRTAAEDNPSDVYTFYRLGLAYLYSSPPEQSLAFWNIARSVALAKASKNPAGDEIEKFLRRVYVDYHGTDEGLSDVITQAAASPTPPEGFKVSPLEFPKPTGNPNIDAFNQMAVPLKVGGERAQKTWDALKGQDLGLGGFVESVQRGAEPNSYIVRIDILDDSRATSGVYDVELRTTTQPNVKNLGKGDIVRFHGKIVSYVAVPNLVLTLDGTINPEDVPDQPRVEEKPKPKPRTLRRPTVRPPQ